MKVSSISVDAWTNGRIMIMLDNSDTVHIQLTEDESNQFRQLAFDIFMSRQKTIAKEIATARPALLADFTEIPSAPEADIPF